MNAWRKCKSYHSSFQNPPVASSIHRHTRLPTFETLRPCAGNNGFKIRTLTCRQRGLGPIWPFWTTLAFQNLNLRKAYPFWSCCAFTKSITYHAHAYNLALFLWQSRTWRLFSKIRQANRPSRIKPYWATMNAWRKCKSYHSSFQNLPEASWIHQHTR